MWPRCAGSTSGMLLLEPDGWSCRARMPGRIRMRAESGPGNGCFRRGGCMRIRGPVSAAGIIDSTARGVIGSNARLLRANDGSIFVFDHAVMAESIAAVLAVCLREYVLTLQNEKPD